MLVYHAITSKFLNDMDEQTIVEQILEGFKSNGIHAPSGSEILSWRNSLVYMHMVLNHPTIPLGCGVAVEYKIPQSGNRVDFILTGLHGPVAGTKEPQRSAIIIELKQWETLAVASNMNDVIRVSTWVGGKTGDHPHPSYQAWSYTQMINKFNEAVETQQISLHPCAFLHNYHKTANDPLMDPRYTECLQLAPVFCHGEIPKLRSFICQHISLPDQGRVLGEIESGKIRPSKSLQDALAALLKGNPEFIMIDDQKVAFEKALSLALVARDTGAKHVLIVRGGPGTGKSVVAINLLVRLSNEELLCKYVSKNSAPRHVYATHLIANDHKKSYINGLFCGSGSFIDVAPNTFGALVVDEAHRLNEKSGLYCNLGDNQTKELISSARFSVFFIDEAQRVTFKDAGSILEIQKWADAAGAQVTVMDLTSQFRCNGSREYLEWVDEVLGLRTGEPDGGAIEAINYDFQVFDDPNELAKAITAKNEQRNKARMVAGYCWNWPKAGKSNPNHKDIVLPEFNFARSWNLASTTTWAIDAQSVDQVGCVHTSQGLEFDYVGVIIGNDLRFEAGTVITDAKQRAKTDQSLKGLGKLAKTAPQEAQALADEIIRNTYRVLMTRGQRGCYVFCTDKALGQYLKDRLAKVGAASSQTPTLATAGTVLEG